MRIVQVLISIILVSILIPNPVNILFTSDLEDCTYGLLTTEDVSVEVPEGSAAGVSGEPGNVYSRGTRSSVEFIDLKRITNGTRPDSTIYGNYGGLLGFSMAAGDVNADGIDDILLGAPDHTVNGSTKAGAVFVIFGSQNGTHFSKIDNLTTAANLTINGSDAFDQAGWAVAVTDFNGDGIGDIIIGAPQSDGFNNSKFSSGEVYVVLGRTVFPLSINLNLSRPGAHQNITIYGNDTDDRFGEELLSIDLITNKPGFEDIAIGAPNSNGPDNSRGSAGEVIILPGDDNYPSEVIVDTDNMNHSVGISYYTIIFGPAADEKLGRVMAAGNLDKDNFNDLVINSNGRGPGGLGRNGCGEVHILNGRDVWPRVIDLATEPANSTIYGQSSGDNAGSSFAIGNVNYDGYTDIVIGAPFADGPDSERVDAGEAYIIYGNGTFTGDIDLDPDSRRGADVTIYGEESGVNQEQFGHCIELADFDYDGTLDIFIASVNGARPDNTDTSGKIYLISTYFPLPGVLDITSKHSVSKIFLGAESGDKAGFDLISGNFDGVPADDILISAPCGDGFSDIVSSSGEVFICFGTRTPRADTRGPVVTSVSPANQSSRIPLDEPIVVTFSEPVVSGSFAFNITPDPGNWQEQWDPGLDKVTLSHDDFTESLWYSFDVRQANDSIGNEFNSSYWNTVRFMTGDFIPPIILQTSPVNNEVNVMPYTNITITFSEEIKVESLKINITPDPGGWLTPEWSLDGTEVILIHTNMFKEMTEYNVIVLNAQDPYGNLLSSAGKPPGWKFTTGKLDPIHPWVEGVIPADKSTDVDIASTIQINFSEPMNITTVVNSISFTPDVKLGNAELGPLENLLILEPVINLLPNTTYTITLKPGARDLNGNSLDGNRNQVPEGSPEDDVVWSFTTGRGDDIILPTIVALRPAINDSGINLFHTIEIEFSEPMNKKSVENAFSVDPPVDGTFLWFSNYMTFLPKTEYAHSTKHTVTLKGTAKDSAGNGLDGNGNGIPEGESVDKFTWSFTTAGQGVLDDDWPTIIRTQPEVDAKTVPVNTNIEIEFSEPMSWAMAADALAVTPILFGKFRWDGNTLIFDPGDLLKRDLLYTVRVSALARDLAGKGLDGNADGLAEGSPIDDFIFTFTTGVISDDSSPRIIEVYPVDGSLNVSRNTVVEIQFSELMQKTSTEAAFVITPQVEGEFNWLDTSMIFIPLEALPSSSKYTVELRHTARDVAGNHIDGNGDGVGEGTSIEDFEFSFTTGIELDRTPPTVLTTRPQNGDVDVILYSMVTINFSEPMNKLKFLDAFWIAPNTPGQIKWSNTSMRFIPDIPFKPLTSYAVTVSYIATDVAGNSLDGNGDGIASGSVSDSYRFSFQTGEVTIEEFGPRLINTTPANGDINVGTTQSIILVFDSPIRLEPEFFSFTCTPDPGGWTLEWDKNNLTIVLEHNKFKKGTEYLFILKVVYDELNRKLISGPVPTTFKFTTVKESPAADGDEYSIGGLSIDSGTLMLILAIIFIWVLVIVVIAAWSLIKLKQKKETEEAPETKDQAPEAEAKVEDVEELEELPPPPEDEVPIVEIIDEEEELPPPPSEDVPLVDDKVDTEDLKATPVDDPLDGEVSVAEPAENLQERTQISKEPDVEDIAANDDEKNDSK